MSTPTPPAVGRQPSPAKLMALRSAAIAEEARAAAQIPSLVSLAFEALPLQAHNPALLDTIFQVNYYSSTNSELQARLATRVAGPAYRAGSEPAPLGRREPYC